MSQLQLYLPIKPLSVNQSFTVIRGRIQSSRENNRYKAHVRKLLYGEEKKVKAFAESCGEYCLFKMSYRYWIPSLYTKKGLVSKTSGDTGNFEKSLTDAIFRALNKYNSNLNDAFIMEVNAVKCQSIRHEYGVTFILEQLCNSPRNKPS